MKTRICEIQIRVVCFPHEAGYAAVALEMDLWGFAESKEEAMSDLMDCVRVQLDHAISEKDLRIAFFNADPEYFDLYETVHKAQFATYIKSGSIGDCDSFANSVALPDAYQIPHFKDDNHSGHG